MRHFYGRVSVVQVFILLALCFITFFAFAGPKGKAFGHEKISPGLARLMEETDEDAELPVIVQMDPDSFHPHGTPPGLLKAKALSLVNGFAGQMSINGIQGLVNSPWIEYVTIDAIVQSTVDNPFNSAVGIEQYPAYYEVRNQLGYNGSSVRVAVFDSGIAEHYDLQTRIYRSIDFTSGAAVWQKYSKDGFGHGTHVAGIIGGDGDYDSRFAGVAPDVQFIDFKVLDDKGAGSTSNLILAIEYAIKLKNHDNIRVANLSLGHPAYESYTSDPLCQAVRRMVDAGIVTVVSAGNLGKTADHPEIWGGINSPGIEPSVITVGAVNTRGTRTHSDDVATSFSSRGYTVPDRLFKPDLVAPGNQIPSLSPDDSYIANKYPQLLIENGYNRDYIYLSGSSMATPFVAGTAALMLDANPYLSPTQVKTLLLLSAVKMTEPHMFEQGNGFLNAYTAVQLAEQMNVQYETLLNDVSPVWILDGEYGQEKVIAGGSFIWDDRVFHSDLVEVTGSFWGDGVIWADNLFDPGSVIWTDNFFDPDGVIWADSVMWSDDPANSTEGDSAAAGDPSYATFEINGVFWSETSSIRSEPGRYVSAGSHLQAETAEK